MVSHVEDSTLAGIYRFVPDTLLNTLPQAKADFLEVGLFACLLVF